MTKFKVEWFCEKHNYPYRFRTKSNNSLYQPKWNIETINYSWYDEDLDMWTNNFYDNCNLNKIHCCMNKCKSFKAVLRKFKKWNLLKGEVFYVNSRYINEEIKITIK